MATKVEMYSATHESVTVARGQRQENTDRVRNQSDCKIRYRALSKKRNKSIFLHRYAKCLISFARLVGTWTFELPYFDFVSLLPELFSATSLHKESALFQSSSNFKAFSSSRCLNCSLNYWFSFKESSSSTVKLSLTLMWPEIFDILKEKESTDHFTRQK